MPYGKSEKIKNNNVNYLGRDFNDLKSSLINYAKTYFPNTYKDFNETSPGMMLLEMSAYVGDVLNFYIDQQYKEMMLPLAEEKRNLINLSKSTGYKLKASAPSYVDLTFTQFITADTTTGAPKYSELNVIDSNVRVASNINSDLTFETLEPIDFTISRSYDLPMEVSSVDNNTGLPTQYRIRRSVRSVSGKTKTLSFNIGEPEKFKKITLDSFNVIEVIKVQDSNDNVWYEVDSLAKDMVPVERHYTSDGSRTNSYVNSDGTTINLPVPYSLQYIKSSKRFITEVGEDGRTNLIFGNGLLKNGSSFSSEFLAIEQVGINIPGAESNLDKSIDPLLGDAYGTLGEAPSHTVLTVTYREGGGSTSNAPSGVITNVDSTTVSVINSSSPATLTCTNIEPAVGGNAGDTVEEIRQKAMSHLSTQNRCVTKEDYEARILNMPAKFGNIAKVYCTRAGDIRTHDRKITTNSVQKLRQILNLNFDLFNPSASSEEIKMIKSKLYNELNANNDNVIDRDGDLSVFLELLDRTYNNVTDDDRLYTIDLYLLSYGPSKELIQTPTIIKRNLKEYLNQFRLLTDQVNFYNGYIINFGVIFDVIGISHENKDEVKLRCIDAIKKYFDISKMNFKQIIYNSEVENLLMDVDGVKAVNYVTLTQDKDYNDVSATAEHVFNPPLYGKSVNSNGQTVMSTNTSYGHYYDFGVFYGNKAVSNKGVILPAYEPAVFELKNGNANIKGIVR